MSITKKDYQETVPEVNLVEITQKLFSKIGDFFSWLWHMILFSTMFLLKKSPWLLGFVVAGMLMAILLHLTSDKEYESEFTISCNTGSIGDMMARVNYLQSYALEKNEEQLMTDLSMEREAVKEIKGIEAFWIIDIAGDGIPDYVDFANAHDPADTLELRMTNRFCVRIVTGNNEDFSKIRDGVIQMINSDDIFRKQNELRLLIAQENMEVLNLQIRKLDSLENVEYFQKRNEIIPSGSQIVFLQERERKLYYSDIINMHGRKERLLKEMELYSDPVTLEQDLSFPIQAINNLKYYMYRWVVFSFSLGLFVLIVHYKRAGLRKIYKQV